MAYSFGSKSLAILAQAHPLLQEVMKRAITISAQDFSIHEAHRSREDQEKAFRAGNTKVHYPNSAHNQTPSCAVDVLPFPFVSYSEPGLIARFHVISLAVLRSSIALKIPIRWGADWDCDGDTADESFRDFPHFELRPWRNFRGGANPLKDR